MWTHNIVSKEFANGQVKVGVNYTNGSQSFNKIHTVGLMENLKLQIKSTLDELDRLEVFFSEIPDVASLDLSVPKDTSSDEKNIYFKEVFKLNSFKEILGASDEVTIAQEALVKSLFKEEYYD